MAGERKLTAQDALALKEKVKAEMLRRCHSGSVASYGGAEYDFTAPPAPGGPVLGEHLKKNLAPMNAVNGDGLPAYPGPLTAQGQAAMETKIEAWATRSLTDRSATDCKSGCTGTCYSACSTGCTGGCSSGCASGCGDACSTGCTSGCTGCTGCTGCSYGCANTCSGACGGICSNDCGLECSTACQDGCAITCYSDCTGTCGDRCERTGP